jgi:biotin-dependent carboxylase-like uncharacterized protein
MSRRSHLHPPEITVLSPGFQALVQDHGRPGLASMGVSPSGFADRRSARLANRLVGNPENAAVVELTIGGAELHTERDLTIAVTGAPGAVVMGGREVGCFRVVHWRAGQKLHIGPVTQGLRRYLAVRGGLDLPPVLGSQSFDVLSELGPAPLAEGTRLRVGAAHAAWPVVDDTAPSDFRGFTTLRFVWGPNTAWFTRDSIRDFTRFRWQVGNDLNRVGIRLDGPMLARSAAGEIPPAAVVRGAIQIPPSGRPTLFLADHPVTGGYPVLGVVVDEDTDLTAQLSPGNVVTFAPTNASSSRLDGRCPTSDRPPANEESSCQTPPPH